MNLHVPKVDHFLAGPTPLAWVQNASENIEILLLDHANCERKAASSAMSLIYRYATDTDLTLQLSKLVREEMRHFEMVVKHTESAGITYRSISPSRYAKLLHEKISSREPERLIDSLLVAALIEARSCERFKLLKRRLNRDLCELYDRLYQSEQRHFETYCSLALDRYGADLVHERLRVFRDVEYHLASGLDTEFRFHSGPLSTGMHSSAIESQAVAIQAHRSQEPST